MGRTPLPLTILVASEWIDQPAIRALVHKGHRVRALGPDEQADLILAPNAHAWHEGWFDKPALLELALRRARERRRASR